MQYLISGIELHLDKGFGITADAYYKSAKHLLENPFKYYESTQQAEMPQNFLYRHSIELYLKSLIIIFHKKLQIDYGTVDYQSEDPEVYIDGQWKKLFTCHFIDKLYYYWLNNLLNPNISRLQETAPQGDWKEYSNITDLFKVLCKYDQDSSYFRYPITKNHSLDYKKYTMQKFKSTNLEDFINEIQDTNNISKKSGFTMLYLDENEKIIDAYKKVDNVLSDIRDALKEVAYYLHCIHIMTRVTLCGGK